ncbi:MAG: hypothetical protein LBV13_03635 [Methanomassiliicoccaceae archaeon]|jgi:hypothetical protein|nr:hypothetical protein [Methanomassiliicoccaceae archaeon]
MSGARSTEELADMYAKQSVGEFFSTAMSVPAKDEPVGERNYINKGCSWPCCNEQGECKPVCFLCCTLGVIGAFACCCYVTDGFGGWWEYWPY